MSDIAIRVENLSKMYQIGEKQERYYTFRDTLANIALAPFRRLRRIGKPPKEEEIIWALKDVSFEVKHGEVVGIIGRNGAGKTTFLKILSRITEPTEGQAEIHGRVGSLLEVGTGFHPELTGRENIFLNGAILGMRKTEINRKFDEIVAFAEIEKFMDTPVKRYSSGMYVRLAFAVAAHLEPEILLVDEVLAVGDAAFQKKCLGKMGDVAKEGRTVLFVSHNMGMINNLCERCILLESGQIIQDGVTSLVISKYLSNISPVKSAECSFPGDAGKKTQIRRVVVVDQELNLKSQFDVFEQVVVEIEYEVREELIGSVVLTILSREGVELFTSFDTDYDGELLNKRLPGYYRARVNLPCPLKAGSYALEVVTAVANSRRIDEVREAVCFEVEELSFDPSLRSYARKRPGVMAAHLVWKTERLKP